MQAKNMVNWRNWKANSQTAILVCFSLICVPGSAQNALEVQAQGKSLRALKALVAPQESLLNHSWALSLLVPTIAPSQPSFTKSSDLSLQEFMLEIQVKQAFFCRIEHQLALKIQMPFKFRLGSVQYVDWLEGKPACDSFAY